MNSLSPELLSHILSFLPRDILHTYATVSLSFQFAIERHTFSTITFQSTSLDFFITAFSPPHRRAALFSIEYHIALPDPCVSQSDFDFDSEDDSEDEADIDPNDPSTYPTLAADNTTFTNHLTSLLTYLSSWPSGRPIILELKAYSPPWICPSHSFLSLPATFSPPSNSRITRLDIVSPRRISGTSVATLASFFPQLKEAQWFLTDDDPGRKAQRDEFAGALALLPNTVRKFKLEMDGDDERGEDPTRISPDRLGVSLSRCLQGVVDLTLGGPIVLGAEVWHGEWPVVEMVSVTLSMETVEGGWWYEYAGDEEEREKLVEGFNGWLKEMTKGVERMKKVKRCEVLMNTNSLSAVEVVFDGEKKRWDLMVGKMAQWNVAEEVRAQWEEMVGRSAVGVEVFG
ncbi:hypothetical protein K440DRAFT_610017 [Wilcoxina mikolae CBS 423.85]|nr:hypothetical protein K440DRAFT_610017 [Wilcoxina mikolae CBS 423.85]